MVAMKRSGPKLCCWPMGGVRVSRLLDELSKDLIEKCLLARLVLLLLRIGRFLAT